MSSKVIFTEKDNKKSSRLIIADKTTYTFDEKPFSGQYGQKVVIKTGEVTIKNSELDLEFSIPFDDDTEANLAEIKVYNLTGTTIKKIKRGNKITIEAGYGTDTGIIFSGYITSRKTKYSDCDKVTTIKALDSMKLKERSIHSITFAKKTKASTILKKLCKKVGLPIADFTIKRDYTYKDKETVDGKLMDNIERLAGICGVSAYILKGKIYVRPLSKGDNTHFTLSDKTGLISVEEFEESETNEKYKDKISGYTVKMLLQHKMQTASILTIKSQEAKGTFRVREGTHEYNGDEFTTTVKVIESVKTTVKKEKKKKSKKKGSKKK